jgi:hypothetical protein
MRTEIPRVAIGVCGDRSRRARLSGKNGTALRTRSAIHAMSALYSHNNRSGLFDITGMAGTCTECRSPSSLGVSSKYFNCGSQLGPWGSLPTARRRAGL